MDLCKEFVTNIFKILMLVVTFKYNNIHVRSLFPHCNSLLKEFTD